MSFLPRSSRPQSRYICQRCSNARRSFSSRTAHHSIAPESPKFIDVPRPPQEYARTQRRIKGVLPVPKNLFPKGSEAKASPLYLDAVTKEPLTRKELQGPEGERLLWKQRMADSRRKNLREGILELHHRKSREEKATNFRRAIHRARREALIAEPEREDERLTRPSVPEVLRDVFKQGHRYDPNKDFEERRLRVAEREALRSDARKDAIHTLYMHARNFITTEDQLNDAVENAFTRSDGTPNDQSIWEGDEPMTTADMLNPSRGPALRGQPNTKEGLAAERMKKIAEELTGGKI
ncbi:hypothetical protein NA57DRAFT_52619 [Rhizodiscina lignyota]|uniref:Uncharacterized protein n=1 Tax=Rhizodiscina lignyota TaxID=1504668 RepID=A0A9P4IRB6_9PEZI|nr:hypothetical protein NA57DRAFT_52619 [Rhizodiscina lignyota]